MELRKYFWLSKFNRLWPLRSHEISPSSSQDLCIERPKEAWLLRCGPVVALVIPTVLSIYLACTSRTLYGFHFVRFVQNSRTGAQIVVQILASLLTLTQVYCCCTLFNFFTRLKAERETLTLRELSFWSALSNTHINWSLPPKYLLLTIGMVVVAFVPGVLWTGALTPVVEIGRSVTTTINLPSYTNRTAQTWNSEFPLQAEGSIVENVLYYCVTVHDSRGLIPSCPVPYLQALLLISASTATNLDPNQVLHSKLDHPVWTYKGRSYGAGSSVGVDFPSYDFRVGSDRVSTVHYRESGYHAQTRCIRNSSSAIRVGYDKRNDGPLLNYYTLEGRLPNEPPAIANEFYPVPIFNFTEPKNVAAWAARTWAGRNMLAIATFGDVGNALSILDKIQCEVSFVPTQFQVMVNMSTHTIKVRPLSSDSPVEDLEPSGDLISNVMYSLNLLSRSSATLYVSTVGNALLTNVQDLQTQVNANEPTDSIVTKAVADSINAVIDDILVAYGASQLVIAEDSKPVKAFGAALGVRLGSRRYIYAAFAANLLVVLACLVELTRTRFWSALSKFNYVNLTSTVLAASAGGTHVSDAFQQWHSRRALGDWDGYGGDPAFDNIEIQIRECRIVSVTAKGVEEEVVQDQDHNRGDIAETGNYNGKQEDDSRDDNAETGNHNDKQEDDSRGDNAETGNHNDKPEHRGHCHKCEVLSSVE